MTPILQLSRAEFNPDTTLYCGQAFRWQPVAEGLPGGLAGGPAGGHEAVVAGRFLRVEVGPSGVTVLGMSPGDAPVAAALLDADLRLETVVRSFPDDPLLQEAARAYPGLRILRQDPWETLASFILSSTKSIVHIRHLVEALCTMAGDPVKGTSRRSFPAPTVVGGMSETELRRLGTGFRAPYLRETAQAVASAEPDLRTLHGRTAEDAREILMRLPGVGPKIADCVLLFGYGRQDTFPLDVWVTRVLTRHYRMGRRLPASRLRENALRRFRPWAGYAQQYLFHYARSHPDPFGPRG